MAFELLRAADNGRGVPDPHSPVRRQFFWKTSSATEIAVIALGQPA